MHRICFLRDRRGSIAPLFATSIFLVLGAIGLCIDGARIYGAKYKLQSAADASVLAAARRAIADGHTDNAADAFNANIVASGITQTLTLRSAAPDLSVPKRLSVELIADVATVVMPVLGLSSVEVRAFSSAVYGFTKLEIGLALDNTGSMAGTKLDALKTSANRLVDTLLDKASNDGDIRISLVPFSQYVNVGMENRFAPWIDVRDDYSETLQSCGDVYPVVSSNNCRMVSYTYYQDGMPMTGSYQQCDVVYGQPVYQCQPYTNTYTWSGCVGSRNHPLNVRDDSYSTRIPGILNASCPSKIQPLTSTRSTLHSAINGMVATGETYVASGVAWGWRTLSPSEPFNESGGEGVDADGNRISKVLIVMTDGENTKSPTYPTHDGANAALANQLTTESCNAVKTAGIQIFTIAFTVTSNPIKDLLTACASNPGNFFDAADTTQLDAAMQAIGDQLGGLRLTN